MKIIYSGLRAENYNPARYPSFEYENFYGTLSRLQGVSVVEFPFDPIVGMGKKWWNKKLLTVVKEQKPDLLFAFMLSDEFETKTLDEIKKITKSVAWFADDHWRIWNYSRYWAPYFTKAVTTWSKAPTIYARWGIKNIIRSQWAAHSVVGDLKKGEKNIAVSFIGQRNSARERIIGALRKAGIEVLVRGYGWPEGKASQEEMRDIISRSKINLNIGTPPSRWDPRVLGRIVVRRSQNKLVPDFHLINNIRCWLYTDTPQIKARPFELAGSGAFVISSYADDLEHYYTEGEEMVFWKNIPELIEKIQYYLLHDEEREHVAKVGYERTVRDHMYEKRFKEIFKNLS